MAPLMSRHLPDQRPLLRIGQLASRTGVPATTLRAWQRRYGVPAPARTDSGYRLYSEADVELVQRLQRLIDEGLAISDASRIVRSEPTPAAPGTSDGELDPATLRSALLTFDGVGAHDELDRLLASHPTSSVLRQVLLPVLADIGDRYAAGTATVAHEHFASNIIRGRLWGLARSWDRGSGARCVLAAAPGDQHELGLLMFGLSLRELGWRITYLGAATPVDDALAAVRATRATSLVISFTRRLRLAPADVDALATFGRRSDCGLAIGGRGASRRLADALHAVLLDVDPVTASRDACFASA